MSEELLTHVDDRTLADAFRTVASGFSRHSRAITVADAAIVILAAHSRVTWVVLRRLADLVVEQGYPKPSPLELSEYLVDLAAEYLSAHLAGIVDTVSGGQG